MFLLLGFFWISNMMHEIYRVQKHPMLPTQLNGKLERQGYVNIKTQEMPFFYYLSFPNSN